MSEVIDGFTALLNIILSCLLVDNPVSTPSPSSAVDAPSSTPTSTVPTGNPVLDIPSLSPSNVIDMNVPSSAPTTSSTFTVPTENPTSLDTNLVWEKVTQANADQIALSSAGNLIFGYQSDKPNMAGFVRFFFRHPNADEWMLNADISDTITSLMGGLGTQDDQLSFSMSSDGTALVCGNKKDGKVVVLSKSDGSWTQVGDIIGERDTENFGEYVDIANDGKRIIAGSQNKLAVFDMTPSWQKVGVVSPSSDGNIFLSPEMNDAGSILYVLESSENATRNVVYFSLLFFRRLSFPPIETSLSPFRLAPTRSGNHIVVEYSNEDFTSVGFAIYERDERTHEFSLILASEGGFFLTLSDDGESGVGVDANSGTFKSFTLLNDEIEETGSFHPSSGNEEDDYFNVPISISGDGKVFAVVIGGIATLFEAN